MKTEQEVRALLRDVSLFMKSDAPSSIEPRALDAVMSFGAMAEWMLGIESVPDVENPVGTFVAMMKKAKERRNERN